MSEKSLSRLLPRIFSVPYLSARFVCILIITSSSASNYSYHDASGSRSFSQVLSNALFQGKNFKEAFDQEDTGNWKVFLPDLEDNGTSYAESKGFGVLEEINPSEGFWVNCKLLHLNTSETTN